MQTDAVPASPSPAKPISRKQHRRALAAARQARYRTAASAPLPP